MKAHIVKLTVPEDQYQEVLKLAKRMHMPVARFYQITMGLCYPMFAKSVEATQTDDTAFQELLLAQGVIQTLKKIDT